MDFIKKYINDLKIILKSKTAQDSTFVFAGNIISKALTLLFTIILARKLGVDSFGDFSLALSIMGLISQFTDLGITTGFVRFTSLYIEENKKKASALIKVTLKFKLLISFLIIIIGWIISPYLARVVFNDSSLLLLLRLSFIGAFGNSIYGYGKAILRSYEMFKKFAYSNIVMGLGKIIILGILAFVGIINVNNSFIIVVTVPFIAAIFNSILIPKNFIQINYNNKIEREVFKELFHFSKWVMISSFAVMLYMRLDIFMLKSISTSLQVGYYSGAQKLAMIFPVLTGSLTSVLLPKISKLKSKSELEIFVKKSLKVTSFMVLPLIILIFLSEYLVLFLLGSDYIGSIKVFEILLIAYIFGILVNPVSLILYNLNKNYLLTILNVIQLSLNYILNLYLIPRWGALGASLSTTSIKIFGTGFIIVSVYLSIKKHFPEGKG